MVEGASERETAYATLDIWNRLPLECLLMGLTLVSSQSLWEHAACFARDEGFLFLSSIYVYIMGCICPGCAVCFPALHPSLHKPPLGENPMSPAPARGQGKYTSWTHSPTERRLEMPGIYETEVRVWPWFVNSCYSSDTHSIVWPRHSWGAAVLSALAPGRLLHLFSSKSDFPTQRKAPRNL